MSRGLGDVYKRQVFDEGYVIATILNVFFLLGLIFISHLENLYILIPFVKVMGITAFYLVVKVLNFRKNNSNI
ncbi:hypothetical protein [Staphylococcus aureus]